MTVLVIGAGVIGASVAEALASRGVRVRLVEMRSRGRGASQASAGLLTPFIEGRVDSTLLELCTRSLTLWDGFIERIRERSHVTVEYARTGTLEVALMEEETQTLANMREWVRGLGVEAQWLEGNEVARFEPAVSARALAGLFIPSQGFVAVPSLVRALAQAARLPSAPHESPVEVGGAQPRAHPVDGETS